MTATLPPDVVTALGITEPGEVILDVVEVNADGSATVETEGGDEEEPTPDEEEPTGPMPPAIAAIAKAARGSAPPLPAPAV